MGGVLRLVGPRISVQGMRIRGLLKKQHHYDLHHEVCKKTIFICMRLSGCPRYETTTPARL